MKPTRTLRLNFLGKERRFSTLVQKGKLQRWKWRDIFIDRRTDVYLDGRVCWRAMWNGPTDVVMTSLWNSTVEDALAGLAREMRDCHEEIGKLMGTGQEELV